MNIETDRGTVKGCDVGGMLVLGDEAPLIDQAINPEQEPVAVEDVPTVQIQEIGYLAFAAASRS